MPEETRVNILLIYEGAGEVPAWQNLLEDDELNIVKTVFGEETVNLLQERDFALVLFDIRERRRESLETAKHLRKEAKGRQTPIIFLTGPGESEKLDFSGFETGPIDYLFDPINPLLLRSKVNVFIKLNIQKKLLSRKSELLAQKVRELGEVKIQLEEAKRKLEELTLYDSLTGLPGRRRFEELVDMEWRRSIRTGRPVSLIMIEIDFFKQFNDHYGRQAGDDCLSKTAKVLKGSTKRAPDFVFYCGKDEFGVVLPETNIDAALIVAERIREDTELLNIPHLESPAADHVTISLGIASAIPAADSSASELMEAAVTFLDEAKEGGGNRVRAMD